MIRLFGVALLVAVSLWGADPARDERWRADLRFLAAELPSRHVNLFARMTRPDFERAVGDLNQAIPDLGDAEVIVDQHANSDQGGRLGPDAPLCCFRRRAE